MKIHSRDRRKWFAANFGRSYFKSQPLINPSGLIGFALPCAVVLLFCAAALWAQLIDPHGASFAVLPLAGSVVSIAQLRQNKADWTLEAKGMLAAATAAGGFTDESRKAYNDLKTKIEKNNELLAAAESQPSADETGSNQQIISQSNEREKEQMINAGRDAERARVQIINETVKALKLRQSFADHHIKAGTEVVIFRKLAIDQAAVEEEAQRQKDGVLGIRTPSNDPRLQDEADARRFGMVGALLERFTPQSWSWDERAREFRYHKNFGQQLFEGSRGYVGLSLLDVAKECLTSIGLRWQAKNRTEIVTLAFQSSSDFPFILANVANKSLRAGYEMTESQWRLIAARRTAPDFKQVSELTLDGSSRLEKVPESGEFKRGKLIEGKEIWQLYTYGKIIGITRQAIINDDLGAFTRTPFLLGQEVAMLEADTVIGIITTNGVLSDNVALFDASTHKNQVGTGSVIGIEGLSDCRILLMTQKSTGNKPLNITPKFLLAPAALGQLAEQYCSPNYQAVEPKNINPLAGRLTPIIEARLDASSPIAWYLFGDPNTPNGTVLIYAYLEGQEGPYTENRQGFDIDGVEVKIRHDFAAAAVDYRGAVKNPGSAGQ